MRIVHFIDSLGIGGKERQAVELVKVLAARGLDLFVVHMGTDDFYEDRLLTIGVDVVHLKRKTWWDPTIFLRFAKIVRKFHPDLIHTNGLLSSFYALPSAKLLRIPLVNGSIRNAFSTGGLRWRIERWLLSHSEYRVANSFAGLRSRGLDVNSGRNVVIYNGFDPSRLPPESSGPPEGCADLDGRRVVGMVAEFSDYKDYPTFLRAACRILDRRSDVVFVTVGDGVLLEECRRAVVERGDAIRFLGRRKDVEAIVRRFDVGILATKTEGFANALLEYMALSKPAVATDGGGNREIVIHGTTGYLVPPGDDRALAEVIEKLLDDPAAAADMGRAGRLRVEREFTLERLAEETLRLYKMALGAEPETHRGKD